MSLWGSFTGSDQKKLINKSSKEAMGYLDTGAGQATDSYNQYYNTAQGYLNPYVQQGQQANSLLSNYLGINGADAQRQAYDSFQTSPGWQASQQAGINALDTSAAARGGLYSGSQQKALYDYGQKNMLQAYNDYIGQLSGQAGQGYQASSGAASLASNQGSNLANLQFGLGQQKASNAINTGNALAQASGIGVNNLMQIGGLALKASGWGGFGVPGKAA